MCVKPGLYQFVHFTVHVHPEVVVTPQVGLLAYRAKHAAYSSVYSIALRHILFSEHLKQLIYIIYGLPGCAGVLMRAQATRIK